MPKKIFFKIALVVVTLLLFTNLTVSFRYEVPPQRDLSRPGEIWGYHFHVYFFPNDTVSGGYAKQLMTEAMKRWSHLTIRMSEVPIGPHPLPMFSISLDKRESVRKDISEILPWMMENHGDLSVLIHPLSDQEHMIPDHQERAAWLGHKVKLNLRAFGLVN